MPASTLRDERGHGLHALRRIRGSFAEMCYADAAFPERSIMGRNQSNGAP